MAIRPRRERAASSAVATPSAAIAATASTGTPARRPPTSIGIPASTPSTTTTNRPRRRGARPAIAAGSTPMATAIPADPSIRTTTAAGSA
jgi:hypothetical protein